MTPTAQTIAALVKAFDYRTARALVRVAIAEGRAYLQAADLDNGGVARVLVDGAEVGQASSLLVNVDARTDTGRPSGKLLFR